MIVPRYWAEARIRHREAGKQITARRFGWSDVSQADAQTIADIRAEDALGKLLSGEKLPRFEPKIPYNGADGVPIREEILDQRGDTIVTRNSYGAHCLNTPNVFFADVDFDQISVPRFIHYLCWISFALGVLIAWRGCGALISGLVIALGIFGGSIAKSIAQRRQKKHLKDGGAAEQVGIERIRAFVAKHPTWNVHVYRTPAGLRVLATHQIFSPEDPMVAKCFSALATDPIYRQMCIKQKCFRARVTPKPWRMGMADHIRPRPGTWPVKPEHLPQRSAWISRYEEAAKQFSACRFIESIGSGVVCSEVEPVLQWHDELSRSHAGLPIA